MNARQRALFLASNAGAWNWLHPSGVYVARALHEGTRRWRERPAFTVTWYPYDWQAQRYRRARVIYAPPVHSDLEADLWLAKLVAQPLARLWTLTGFTPPLDEEERLPPSLYSRQGKGLSWYWARPDGLYLAQIRRTRRGYGQVNAAISCIPYSGASRWCTLWRSPVSDYSWETAQEDFLTMTTGVETFLMASLL